MYCFYQTAMKLNGELMDTFIKIQMYNTLFFLKTQKRDFNITMSQTVLALAS